MQHNILKTAFWTIKHWYIPLIVGIVFIGVGSIALITPKEAYLTLTFLFSFSFVITGLMEISFALKNRQGFESWGMVFSLGLLNFLIGMMLLLNPKLSMLVLALYIGFWVLLRSINLITFSVDLKNYGIQSWWKLLLLGIVGAVLACVLLLYPNLAGLGAVFWTAVALILLGVTSIYFAMILKKIRDFPKKISDSVKAKFRKLKQEIETEFRRK